MATIEVCRRFKTKQNIITCRHVTLDTSHTGYILDWGQQKGSYALIPKCSSLTSTARQTLMDSYVHSNCCLNLSRRLSSQYKKTNKRKKIPERHCHEIFNLSEAMLHSLYHHSFQITIYIYINPRKKDPIIWLQGNTMQTLDISNVYHWPSFETLCGQTELTLGHDGWGLLSQSSTLLNCCAVNC